MLEKEIKVLDVNRTEIEEQLVELWAKKVYDGHLFDVNFHKPARPTSFKIRLRKNTYQAILTFKRRPTRSDSGIKVREEYEYVVDRLETWKALTDTWLVPKSTKYKQRVSYQLWQMTFDFDQYASLPTFLEVEWPSKAAIMHRVERLWLIQHTHLTCGTKWLFKYYGFRSPKTFA